MWDQPELGTAVSRAPRDGKSEMPLGRGPVTRHDGNVVGASSGSDSSARWGDPPRHCFFSSQARVWRVGCA